MTINIIGVQQEKKCIIEPLNGSKYFIYCDGTLFNFLATPDGTDQQRFEVRVPTLKERSLKVGVNTT